MIVQELKVTSAGSWDYKVNLTLDDGKTFEWKFNVGIFSAEADLQAFNKKQINDILAYVEEKK